MDYGELFSPVLDEEIYLISQRDSSFLDKKPQSTVYTSASTGSKRRREYGTPTWIPSSENLDYA
ncbi:hypothetical protein DAPPUDRAFT_266997 [Daphnia pulex]|uniref:Uncharacterized protein n=1 Tax=Daphnia pulex TaxID=6669 RepID=E9HVV3_DAPPU|nr:hypothetical protein DAPPUDRAFT_266997 [Daphnia pulex]|eukprot:EFX64128.1 hypothetical protein DAPPUDRAFT_266997 [Daphnia pulex]